MSQLDPSTPQEAMAPAAEDSPAAARPTLSVIVPTYREAENLPELVPAVHRAVADAGIDAEIIIVDDDSRDGTEEVIAQLAEEYPVRLLVRRGERGLATAVLHGFAHARGDILACMDADGSHPAVALPEMVSAIGDGRAEFVLGSRYVPGASTDEQWSVLRAINSKVATLLSRPFTKVRDPMSGYFAISRERFEAADPLDPIGYKISLELLVKSHCRRPLEIPIHFRDRTHGESKLGLREIINYLRHVGRLWRYRLTRRAR